MVNDRINSFDESRLNLQKNRSVCCAHRANSVAQIQPQDRKGPHRLGNDNKDCHCSEAQRLCEIGMNLFRLLHIALDSRNPLRISTTWSKMATECCCCWSIVVKEKLLLERLTLANVFFVDFRLWNVCFCSTFNEHCHFSSEKRWDSQNVFNFSVKSTFRKQNHGNRPGLCVWIHKP